MKVWVNGSFDVLHLGHIRLLEYANQYGEVRVGLDTDERIREKKGEGRPFNKLNDRMEFMKSIRFVTSVTSFGSDEELEDKIKEYEPDYMVIGGEYKYMHIIGLEFVPKILFFDKVDGKSTSAILNRYNTNEKDSSNRI